MGCVLGFGFLLHSTMETKISENDRQYDKFHITKRPKGKVSKWIVSEMEKLLLIVGNCLCVD